MKCEIHCMCVEKLFDFSPQCCIPIGYSYGLYILYDNFLLCRGAGGSFGKKEKAIEDQYFHNLVSANSVVQCKFSDLTVIHLTTLALQCEHAIMLEIRAFVGIKINVLVLKF